jgi:plastocyanin
MLRLVSFAFIALSPLSAAEVAFSFIDAKNQPIADAVLSLVPLDAPATLVPPASPLVIAQEKQEFLPYVSAVQVGTRVDFPNRDTIKHQVYSSSKAKRFELPLYAGEAREPVVFDKPGVVTLGCNIHDHMLAYVMVVETPWFATSGGEGSASIASVPPGRYRAEIWQPRLAALVTRELMVPASGNPERTTVTLELGRDRRIRRNVDSKAGGY